jgi:DNA-binding helix-hairpin-helix protein with protein kinase domain
MCRVALDKNYLFCSELKNMLHKVIELYELGYLHGDLQPNHFIIDAAGGYHMIDLETAFRMNDPESSYRGALVHYVSPEIADGMMNGNESIPLDVVSEIYSFAAVVFFLATEANP